jgi:hypothetical protein
MPGNSHSKESWNTTRWSSWNCFQFPKLSRSSTLLLSASFEVGRGERIL